MDHDIILVHSSVQDNLLINDPLSRTESKLLVVNDQRTFDHIVSSDSGSIGSGSSRKSKTIKWEEGNEILEQTPEPKKQKRKQDKNWTKKAEVVMCDWKLKTQGYAWMHTHAARFYSLLNALFGLPILILSTLLSTNAIASFMSDQNNPGWLTVAIGCITIMVTILSATQTFFDFAKQRSNHVGAKQGFNFLTRKIQNELVKSRSKRHECYGFYELIGNEYDQMLELDTGLPNFIINKYRKGMDQALSAENLSTTVEENQDTILPLFEPKIDSELGEKDCILHKPVPNHASWAGNQKNKTSKFIKHIALTGREDSFSYMDAIRAIEKYNDK